MKKPIIDDYNNEMYRKTLEYQKKYGFELGTSQKELTHNNEADAFKHAFMQAVGSERYGAILAALGGLYHENISRNQPSSERNMDLWNNNVGRKIAAEIRQELMGERKNPKRYEDLAAQKIMERMRRGELITNPEKDSRIYKEPLKVSPKKNVKKYFSLEQVKSMTRQDFKEYRPDIMAQYTTSGFPPDSEIQQKATNGEMVYIQPYERKDGTKVCGYYRTV